MDKTYAETQGKAPFDWNQFIEHAAVHGITSRQHEDAQRLSLSFVTCACGNQCAIIPRDCDAPVDMILFDLGCQFAGDIQRKNWPAARATLAAIEARSAVLIREELAKLNATASPALPMLVPFAAREGL